MDTTRLDIDGRADKLRQWHVLIQAARGGCDDALSQIVNEFREYLLMVAEREISTQLQAKFDASDVVQNSLVEAMSSIEQFRGSSEHEIRSWLTKLVLHNLQDQARQYTKTRSRAVGRENVASGVMEILRDDMTQTPSSAMSTHEQDNKLKLLIKQLPEQQQIVLNCRHRHEMSYEQIADRLDITEPAARKLWSRATIQLRKWLKDDSAS